MIPIAALLLMLSSSGQADDKAAPTDQKAAEQPTTDASGGERVNVENIKQKYWARGDESELGVVQNRLYSKAGKFEFGLLGGVVATDPFLSVQSLGFSLGYHFSEYLSFHGIAWKTYVGPSSASDAFTSELQSHGGIPAIPDSNFQNYFYGGEVRWSFLYGKLSVLGKAIIYYDFRFLGGVGITNTQTGNDFTPYLGVGQQVFLSKTLSLLIDYRLMRYNEVLLQKSNPAAPNTLGESRTNWTDAITLGFSFMFGFGGK
jgi:outer membrane beta-barrel protein